MANGEQSRSGGQSDWRVRLVTCVGAWAGLAVAMLVGSLVDLPRGLLWGFIEVGVGITAGILLGRVAGKVLFR